MSGHLRLLKGLAEESRYRIVCVLMDGERCACEIPGLIGRTQSNTSIHLSKLTEYGLLKSRREGKKIIYSIKDRRIKGILRALRKPSGQ